MVAQTRLTGNTDSTLKKLKDLYNNFASYDQDDVDRKVLDGPRTELIGRAILHHKDQGVRAYAACCLAELLRLYAPDAPYTQPELRDIFQFFIKQLQEGLKTTDSAYHSQYFALLESLATVKSAVLICDLPSGDELMVEVFRTFFWIANRGTANKKMEHYMSDILAALLDECEAVPTAVLDNILAQFMDKEPRLDKQTSRMAITICNKAADKLQRPVCQYFAEVIVNSAQAGGDHDDDDEEEDKEAKNEKIRNLENAHELIKRLHRNSPAILHGVIPQITEELRTEHDDVRLLATKTLGDMYADNNGNELAIKYPATWEVWWSRKNDKIVPIRHKFVECLRPLLGNLPVKRDDIIKALEGKLLDPDEKVRLVTCKLFSQIDYDAALHHVPESLLKMVAERFRDRKPAVRAEAVNGLGKLYGLAYPEIENNDVTATKHFGWIPSSILESANSVNELRNVIERAWATHILPLTTSASSSSSKSGDIDEVAWTEKLLIVTRQLSERNMDVLIMLAGIREVRPNMCEKYLEACLKYNGGIIDEDEEKVTKTLKACIQHLTFGVFQNDHKASEDLHTFAKLNESRLYKLLRTCLTPQTDLKTLAKTSAEFLRRLDQSTPSSSSTSTLTQTMHTLLLRSSFSIINTSIIPTLFKKLQPSNLSFLSQSQSQSQTQAQRRMSNGAILAGKVASQHSEKILKAIAKWCPGLGKVHVSEFCRILGSTSLGMEDENEIEDSQGESGSGNEEERRKTREIVLKLLANLVRVDSSVVVNDKKTIERMEKIVLEGGREEAKFGSRFLVLNKGSEEMAKVVLKKLVDDLKEADDARLSAHISGLIQYARYSPHLFEEASDVVIEMVVKRVLNVPILNENQNQEDDNVEEWYEDTEEIPDLLWAKIGALKIFRHRCLNVAIRVKSLLMKYPQNKNANVNGNGDEEKGKEKEKEKEHDEITKAKERAGKIAAPVIKMAMTLLNNGGAMSNVKGLEEDPKAKSRLRLQASITLIQLSRMDIYNKPVMPHFGKLVLTIQDTCYGVRSTYLMKLMALFSNRKLPPHFGVIFFLTVHDPEDDIRNTAAHCIRGIIRKISVQERVQYFELLFVRLLHTLAHHPDFGTENEELLDLSKYIQFYLDLVATSDNVSLLYHLASKGKTVRDQASFMHSENFYILCELAQELIKARASQPHNSWSIQSYPGKVRLPSDILRPLPNAEAANKIAKTIFLSDQVREWVIGAITGVTEKKEKKERREKEKKEREEKRERDDEEGGETISAISATGKGKRKASTGGAGRGKNGVKRRRKEWEDDDDDDDDDNDDDEDDEEEDEDDDEGDDEEQEDDDMDTDNRNGRPKRKNGTKAKAATKAKKNKRKSDVVKVEEEIEQREAKGLRISARTKAKVQAAKRESLKGEGDASEDEEEVDVEMEE